VLEIQGLLTVFVSLLPESISRPARIEGAFSIDHTRATEYAAGREIGPALRVEDDDTPLLVARRSFGVANLPSSRLDWRIISLNSDDTNTVNRPWALLLVPLF